MRFVFLAYGNEAAWASLTVQERDTQVQMFGAFVRDIEQRGIREANLRLTPSSSAKTVRDRDGQPVINSGPYAATQEQISGVYVLNCKDWDEALEMAKKLPAARFGVVEVRAVME